MQSQKKAPEVGRRESRSGGTRDFPRCVPERRTGTQCSWMLFWNSWGKSKVKNPTREYRVWAPRLGTGGFGTRIFYLRLELLRIWHRPFGYLRTSRSAGATWRDFFVNASANSESGRSALGCCFGIRRARAGWVCHAVRDGDGFRKPWYEPRPGYGAAKKVRPSDSSLF